MRGAAAPGRVPATPADRSDVAAPGSVRRGRLLEPSAVPLAGERFEELVSARGVRIEQILSSNDVEPTVYDQDTDEWVVVLAGAATLDLLAGDTVVESVELLAGDWILLPAHTRHRVSRVEPATSWLAVHTEILRSPS